MRQVFEVVFWAIELAINVRAAVNDVLAVDDGLKSTNQV